MGLTAPAEISREHPPSPFRDIKDGKGEFCSQLNFSGWEGRMEGCSGSVPLDKGIAGIRMQLDVGANAPGKGTGYPDLKDLWYPRTPSCSREVVPSFCLSPKIPGLPEATE